MTGKELETALAEIGWSVRQTEKRFRLPEKAVTRMVRGTDPIPEWLALRVCAIAAVVKVIGRPTNGPTRS